MERAVFACFPAICAAALLAGWPPGAGTSRGDEAISPTGPGVPREVAADGTVSVVVNPPLEPAAARAAGALPAAAPEPAALLGELLEPLDAAAAPGLYNRPLPLLEALERPGDRSRRLWITQAYWKVVAAFAGLRQAVTAADRIELVAPGSAPRDRVVLDALAASARAERAEAEAALVVAQQELVDLVRLPAGEPPPWPVDRPLVTAYQTQFDTIFAARVATGRVRAINRALPSRHQAIETRAAAVRSAAEAFSRAEVEHAQGAQPIESVAAAAELLDAQERAFIDGVRVYNAEIAEYVMAVADFSVPDDRFAAMLIGTPTPWRREPGVIAAGVAAEVPAQAPPPLPIPTIPPPAFLPPAGLPPAPPAQPVIP